MISYRQIKPGQIVGDATINALFGNDLDLQNQIASAVTTLASHTTTLADHENRVTTLETEYTSVSGAVANASAAATSASNALATATAAFQKLPTVNALYQYNGSTAYTFIGGTQGSCPSPITAANPLAITWTTPRANALYRVQVFPSRTVSSPSPTFCSFDSQLAASVNIYFGTAPVSFFNILLWEN